MFCNILVDYFGNDDLEFLSLRKWNGELFNLNQAVNVFITDINPILLF